MVAHGSRPYTISPQTPSEQQLEESQRTIAPKTTSSERAESVGQTTGSSRALKEGSYGVLPRECHRGTSPATPLNLTCAA